MLPAPCEIHLPPALPRRTSFRLRRVFDSDSAAALFLRWNRTTPHLRSRTRAQGPSRLARPVPGLVAFHGKWAFYYLGGGADRASSQAKQSCHSSLATLLWHRGPVTKSVTRANRARAAGPAARAHRVPIAVGGRKFFCDRQGYRVPIGKPVPLSGLAAEGSWSNPAQDPSC